MGMPARKIEAAPKGARLRLVEASVGPAEARRASRSSARSEAECRAVFTGVALLFVALTIFALGRVALTAELTRTAFDSGELRQEIKAERELAERLEASRSALMTPSRIEDIAAKSMKMTQPANVRYIRLPSDGSAKKPAKKAPERTPEPEQRPPAAKTQARSAGLSRLITAAMEIAADEAGALLVGDVGLATSR